MLTAYTHKAMGNEGMQSVRLIKPGGDTPGKGKSSGDAGERNFKVKEEVADGHEHNCADGLDLTPEFRT